jgi:hypothetical protein
VFGVDVEHVEAAGPLREVLLRAGEEAAQDWRLEGMEEERDGGCRRQRGFERVALNQADGRERTGVGAGFEEADVVARDRGQRGVELDPDGLAEGMQRSGATA